MDNVSPDVRTRTMRAVKGRDTAPELRLRRALFAAGLRGYRVAPQRVTGHPDLAYIGLHIALFVDGCYWHGCEEHCRRPSSNVAYWNAKIERNMNRDRRTNEQLKREGWIVVRVWEHQIKAELCAVVTAIQGTVEARRASRSLQATAHTGFTGVPDRAAVRSGDTSNRKKPPMDRL